MNEHIHSCGYHCDRPACVKDQRDELVRKYIIEQEATELNDEKDRHAFELVAGEGNLKCKSLERSGDGYKFIWVDQAWKWWKAALLYQKQENVFNAKEFNKMVKRGTEAWKDTPNNFVDDLRGN